MYYVSNLCRVVVVEVVTTRPSKLTLAAVNDPRLWLRAAGQLNEKCVTTLGARNMENERKELGTLYLRFNLA